MRSNVKQIEIIKSSNWLDQVHWRKGWESYWLSL